MKKASLMKVYPTFTTLTWFVLLSKVGHSRLKNVNLESFCVYKKNFSLLPNSPRQPEISFSCVELLVWNPEEHFGMTEDPSPRNKSWFLRPPLPFPF